MDVSAFVLLSHEQALRRRLDVAANNMANVNTIGFKREQPLFHEYVEQTSDVVEAAPENGATTSFVLDFGAVHDTAQGAFQPTGNPLDMMIEGPGYLSVETPGGQIAYTRAGMVKVLPSGELTTSGGHKLLGEDGRPVSVPVELAGQISIGSQGTIDGPGGPFGRLVVTVFDDERRIAPHGDGLLTGQGGRQLAAAETKLRTGGVEGSNVQPIAESTAMVEILRAYQTSMQMTESLNDMRRRAIDRLGRVG